jgi:hypothetical protein
MLIRIFTVSLLVLGGTLISFRVSTPSVKGEGLDDLEFIYDSYYEAVWPIEWWIKQPVFVRNNGVSALNLSFLAEVVETGAEISAFPQPYYLYLDPGENQTIWVPLDSAHLDLPMDIEANYTRTVKISFWLKGGDPSINKTININYFIRVLPRTWYLSHPNAKIHGYLYDRVTGLPISGTRVEFRSPGIDYGCLTNDSGYYEINFYAHRNVMNNRITPYSLSVEPSGYEAFIKPFWPVSGDEIRQDAYLERTKENVTANLLKRVETNMTIYRGAVTKDERFVVFAQGHPELNITDEEVRQLSSVLLFDTNGTLLWKYTPYGQIWSVDISEDGAYVAATIIDTGYPPNDRAILLDHYGNEVWNTSDLGSYGSREIKISHNGKYVAWGAGDGDLFLFNLTNRNILWKRFLEGQIRQIVFSSDDTSVFAGSGDGYLYIIRVEDGQILARAYIEAWPYSTVGLKLSADDAYVATASKLGNITLVNAITGEVLWTFDTMGGANSVDISPNKDYVIAGSGGTIACSLFDIDGNLRWWKASYDTKSEMIMSDGTHIVVGRDWGIDIINTNGTVLWSYWENFSYIPKPVETHFVYVFKNQTRIIVGHGSGAVYFWNLSINSEPVDNVPPTTLDDYDGLWHTANFIINLTATDDLSGVAETYYRINDGSIQNVSAHGQPLITCEGADNKLEYWSIDNAGNEESHHVLTEIKLDKTAPTGSVSISNDATYTNSISVTLALTASDDTSGVYQVRYSNDGVWDTEPWETPTPTKTWTLTSGDGTKTIYYQIKDNAGLVSTTYSDTIILDETAPIIDIPSREPAGDVQPNQPVKVSVNVTDATTQVKNVTLYYSLDNGTTWEQPIPMTLNSSNSLYEATILGQPIGTLVRYKIVAYDYAGNNATLDGTEPYSVYQVVPEFSPNLILPIIIIFSVMTLFAIITCRRNQA